VGEIGIPPVRFKCGLKWWEIKAIVRGYNRREIEMWSATRWHAYHIMSVMPYCDLYGKGVHNPTDLLPLPGDKKNANLPTTDEMEQFQREADELNKQRGFG